MRAATEKTLPYTLSLPDGTTLFVRIPVHMTGHDRDGTVTLNADGMRLLDRVRALAMKTPAAPSPGYIRAVRDALRLTQADFARRIGYSTISIKKWEAGTARPGTEAVRKLQTLVEHAGRRGILLSA